MSSSFLPLNAKQDVRPGTRNPGIFDSTLINSSLTPSLKYSSFLSALMFTKGNTAIDFAGNSLGDVMLLFRAKYRRTMAAPIANNIAAAVSNFLRGGRLAAAIA